MQTREDNDQVILSLLRQLSESGTDFIRNRQSRAELLNRARALVTALTTPEDTILWMAWAEPTRQAAIRTALRMRLFYHLQRPRTITELTQATDFPPSMLLRTLRHLAATGIVAEVGPGRFANTPLSDALCDQRNAASMFYTGSMPGPVLGKMDEYLEINGFAEPRNILDGPFQHGMDTTLSPWEWISDKPDVADNLALHLSGCAAMQSNWMEDEFYPIEERLCSGFHNDDVFLVDVGGGKGDNLEQIRTKQPAIAEGKRFVLQDLKTSIEECAEERPWVKGMAHDVFDDQPVKGARAYLLHSVLQDWSNEDCRRILQPIRDAMKPGYSKILIYENVIPDQNAPWQMTSLDWMKMVMAASSERSEKQWRMLLSSAGLRVSGIWTRDPKHPSLIEVVVDGPKL